MSDTRISEKALRAFMERAYEKEGFEAEEARQIADVLMQADLFGIESHGAQRMMYYHQNIKSGSVDVRARAEVLRETPVSALMDGHFAMGHLTAAKAMRMAIEKAKTAGIGMVAVRNSSHYGIAGYYPLMAEREGLAAFSMTNTGPIMVPTFGRQMMLGTQSDGVLHARRSVSLLVRRIHDGGDAGQGGGLQQTRKAHARGLDDRRRGSAVQRRALG